MPSRFQDGRGLAVDARSDAGNPPLPPSSRLVDAAGLGDESRWDLSRLFFERPEAALLVRADEDVESAGVSAGDLLVADCQAEATDGKLVVAQLDGRQKVMRVITRGGRRYLTPNCGPAPLRELGRDTGVAVLAVVTCVIRVVPD